MRTANNKLTGSQPATPTSFGFFFSGQLLVNMCILPCAFFSHTVSSVATNSSELSRSASKPAGVLPVGPCRPLISSSSWSALITRVGSQIVPRVLLVCARVTLLQLLDRPVVQAQEGGIPAFLSVSRAGQCRSILPFLQQRRWESGRGLKRGHEQPSHLGSVGRSSVHQTCVFGRWGKR